VKLRVSHGDVPEFGDVLEMRTGRRYQVIGVKRRALTCIVLPPKAEIEDRVIPWQWTPRERKRA
jgi:hypothetical protein